MRSHKSNPDPQYIRIFYSQFWRKFRIQRGEHKQYSEDPGQAFSIALAALSQFGGSIYIHPDAKRMMKRTLEGTPYA